MHTFFYLELQNRILYYILPQFNDNSRGSNSILGKRKLADVLAAEKLNASRSSYADHMAASSQRDFVYLKHLFVLVEEKTHLFRPAIIEDYRAPEPGQDPPWPKLYAVPQGRCPFIPYEDPTSSKNSETEADPENERLDEEENNRDSDNDFEKENTTPELRPISQPVTLPPLRTPQPRANNILKSSVSVPGKSSLPPYVTPARCVIHGNKHNPEVPAQESTVADSNASGIPQSRDYISTSIALPSLQGGDSFCLVKKAIDNLSGTRLETLSKRQQTEPAHKKITRRNRLPPVPRIKKARVPIKEASTVSRPGYCENCKVKYEDMNDHIVSVNHRKFATTQRNWEELDMLLSGVRRPLGKRTQSTQTIPLLSSDPKSLFPLTSETSQNTRVSDSDLCKKDEIFLAEPKKFDSDNQNHHLSNSTEVIMPNMRLTENNPFFGQTLVPTEHEKALPLLMGDTSQSNWKAATAATMSGFGTDSLAFNETICNATARAAANFTGQSEVSQMLMPTMEYAATPCRVTTTTFDAPNNMAAHVQPIQVDSSSSASTVYPNHNNADPFGFGPGSGSGSMDNSGNDGYGGLTHAIYKTIPATSSMTTMPTKVSATANSIFNDFQTTQC